MNAVAQQGSGLNGFVGGAGTKRSPGRHLHLVPAGSAVVEPQGRETAATFARRRFAALVLLVLVLAGAVLAGRAMAAGESPVGARVTVSSGETLSQIAVREMPDVRVSEAVVAIEQANGLASSQVDAGQNLVIPRS